MVTPLIVTESPATNPGSFNSPIAPLYPNLNKVVTVAELTTGVTVFAE